jgi:hypothetical protein
VAITRRRQPPPEPHPCDCRQRVAELEDLAAAIVGAIITLRPRAANHTIEQGLVGWGVGEPDARKLADAYRQRHT